MKEKQASVLEQRLRSERPSFAPRAGFTERVMEALPARSSQPVRKRAEGTQWLPLAIAVGATAALALAASQYVFHRDPVAAAVANVKANSQNETTEELKLPAISLAQVQELSTKLDEPLQNELKNVISDTRQAIQFVASNFLPDRPEN